MKFQYIKDKGKAGTTGSCNVDTSQPDWYSSDSWGIGFPEGYFSAETFHNAYPSVGMPMGRAFAE